MQIVSVLNVKKRSQIHKILINVQEEFYSKFWTSQNWFCPSKNLIASVTVTPVR